MPQSNSWRDLIRLVLFTFAAWALWALGRNDAKPGAVDQTETTEPTRKRSGFSKRRLATSLAFATLFFSGAAFTAGAGDQAACLVDDCTPAAESATTSTEESEATDPPGPEDPAADPAPEAPVADDPPADDPADDGTAGGSGDGQPADQPADQGGSDDQPSDDGAAPASGDEDGSSAGGDNASGGDNGSGGGGQPAEEPDSPAAGPGSPSHAGDGQSQSQAADSPVDVDAAHDSAVDAENASSFGTFWLHRTLPDPTPPARRLEPRFARNLVSVSRSQHVDWALVLAVVRAHGNRTSVPASKTELRTLASNLRRLHASQ